MNSSNRLPQSSRLGFFWILLCWCTACASHLAGPHQGREPPLALWVECQGENHTLDSRRSIDTLVEDAKRWNVDVLLAQVYRSGLAWYRSDATDRAPAVSDEFDPLAYLLERARAEGVAVHAWVNVFNLAMNSEARILKELGEEVLTKDNFGRSVRVYLPAPGEARAPRIEGFMIGTPGLWLDPGIEAVRNFQLRIVEELIAGYPALAGIHLDFIRYPYALPLRPVSNLGVGVDFGYAETALAAFRVETSREPPLRNEELTGAGDFDVWRRSRVSAFVQAVSQRVRVAGMQLSVAALSWADRAYLSSFQDWRGWIEQGFIDQAVVMNYARDEALARHISRAALAAGDAASGGHGAWIGLGAYLFGSDPESLRRQMDESAALGAPRLALFSYDRIKTAPALDKWLAGRAPALPRESEPAVLTGEYF